MAHNPNSFGEVDSSQPRTNLGSSRLFVGDLPAGTTESQLYNYFRKFGALQHVFIPHSVRGKQKLFAFVQFESDQDAERALTHCKATPLKSGAFLRVELAVPEEARPSSPVLSNIPKGADLQEVADLASAFGPLLKVTPYSMLNSKVGCRVKFASVDSAYRLLEHRHLQLASGDQIEVKPYVSQSLKQAVKHFRDLKSEGTSSAGFYGILRYNQQPVPSCASRAVIVRRTLTLEAYDEHFSGYYLHQRVESETSVSDHALATRLKAPMVHSNIRFNLRIRTQTNL